jgi:hypothetical protein
MEITGNLRYVAGVTEYVVDGNDGTINIDTSVNSVTIILPNINNSGFANTSKGFIINDISSNASVNNIVITANGNSVNSASSVIISNNGGSAKCSIANINEWFVITEPQTGGGTVTNADNGLSLNVNTIELGGTLIQSTTIATDSTNTLNITDSFGNAFTTRDANGNWGLATNSTNLSSQYVNDYISGGNVYDNSLIVVNFGSVKTFTNATDCWTFGDYGTFENSIQTFSFGRTPTLTSTSSAFTIGDDLTINSSSGIFCMGVTNTILTNTNTSTIGLLNYVDNATNSFILGNNNTLAKFNFNTESLYNFGDGLSLTTTANIRSIVNIGFVNTLNLITPSAGIYIIGDSNNIIDSCNYTLLFGESVTVTRSDYSFIFGIYHVLTDSSAIWTIGEGNNINTSSYNLILGQYNTIDSIDNCLVIGNNNLLTAGCSNISVLGNSNTLAVADAAIIGNNNLNLIVDIFGNIGNVLTMTSKLHITGLLEFIDNADALANSLTVGAFYRTGDIVKVVH